MTDTWAQITGLTNKPDFGTGCNGNGNNQFQVFFPEYGVIMYVDHNTSPLSVYLYRHTTSASTMSKKLIQFSHRASLRVTQNSSGSNLVISWAGAKGMVQVDIFSLNGCLIRSSIGFKNSMVLNTNGLDGMTCLLKVSSGSEIVYQKVLVRR